MVALEAMTMGDSQVLIDQARSQMALDVASSLSSTRMSTSMSDSSWSSPRTLDP